MRSSASSRYVPLLLVAAACTVLASCGGLRLGKRDRPAAEPVAAEQPARRRGALKFFRRGKSEAPPPAPAARPEHAPPPRPREAPPPETSRPETSGPEAARPRVEPKVARPKVSGAGELVAAAPAEVRRRAAAYLAAKGFSMQPDDETGATLLTDPLLSTASIDHLADCGGKRLANPILHSTELELRFAPEGAGTRVTIGALFTEVRQGKVSKGMSKAACKTRGVLEAEVLGALKR